MPRHPAAPYAALAACFAAAGCGEPSFCNEAPDVRGPALSLGAPWSGRVQSAARFVDTPFARVLPRRHARRCVAWGTPRLVHAIARAGRAVAAQMPGTPPLGVGDLSRARGGPLPYSRSHQAGRDADLAFYQLDAAGRAVAAEDLARFGPGLASLEGPARRFDLARNWLLVRALASDPAITVRALYISDPLRAALLAHARRGAARPEQLAAVAAVLHQPAGAAAHDDHLHVRIGCTNEERARGCIDG